MILLAFILALLSSCLLADICGGFKKQEVGLLSYKTETCSLSVTEELYDDSITSEYYLIIYLPSIKDCIKIQVSKYLWSSVKCGDYINATHTIGFISGFIYHTEITTIEIEEDIQHG